MTVLSPDLKHRDTSNWYAIYTKPRAEKKVFERLTLSGFDAYLPMVTSVREWSDRKKEISIPLISSFVFVNVSKELLFETLKIQGSLRVLRYLGKPAVIRDYEIENLKILMNDTTQFSTIENSVFEKGEPVEVISGPFAGLKGQSVTTQGKHRIIIDIEAIGSRLAVNVPLVFVRRVVVLSSSVSLSKVG